jgi:hypothetical protein
MSPPGDRDRERAAKELDQIRQTIENNRHTIDLIKRESAEQTQAIAGLKNVYELMQQTKKWEHKDLNDALVRLTADVKAITDWRHQSYKDMWEGDKSFAARIRDLERGVENVGTILHDLREDLPKLIADEVAKRDGAINGRVRIEHTKGFWALLVGLAVALAAGMGSLVKMLIESGGTK